MVARFGSLAVACWPWSRELGRDVWETRARPFLPGHHGLSNCQDDQHHHFPDQQTRKICSKKLAVLQGYTEPAPSGIWAVGGLTTSSNLPWKSSIGSTGTQPTTLASGDSSQIKKWKKGRWDGLSTVTQEGRSVTDWHLNQSSLPQVTIVLARGTFIVLHSVGNKQNLSLM